METQKTILAIALSVVILLGYQYFFVPAPPQNVPDEASPETTKQAAGPTQAPQARTPAPVGGQTIAAPPPEAVVAPSRAGRDIPVETSLYKAVVTETGGGIKSFELKDYREFLPKDSPPEELIRTDVSEGLPLFFSWGVEPARAGLPVFSADRKEITVPPGQGTSKLVMATRLPSGLEITRALTFHDQDYRMDLVIDVRNTATVPLQGAPYLALNNRPFSEKDSNHFLFTGPAVYLDGRLEEVKVDDLIKKGGESFTGNVQWAAYEDTYFMCSIIPDNLPQATVHFSVGNGNEVTSVVAGPADLIPPQGSKQYTYTVYFGPKKMTLLKAMGHNLDQAVNFGWFGAIARPTLYLLNFFYKYVRNYGVAIILVTILIKMLFWPIAHKGMKSMKTMQKLQPKMTKIREKYKDDRERQQREMMELYKTYKVNPLGGCLPMVLQIPVFFSLYKVLLQAIELRHAPFMLWINDLSAPDRLSLGFHIPYLGGLPVLTLLMGGSMFLQQRMTPTTGDPTQAKIMMFLPVVFTFMFINFASGLVLYWLVNNLLTIAQQYVINRQVE